MTQEEREDFFQQIKGKKIYWSSWGEVGSQHGEIDYFIPETRTEDIIKGVTYYLDGFPYPKNKWNIMEGFDPIIGNTHWLFYESKSSTSTNKSCTCDLLKVIMIQGCQCGSV